jgi:hypothetical protein
LVVFLTKSGPCGTSSTYPVTVRSGRVRYAGDDGYNVTGLVDKIGNVNVTISAFEQRATANGKLSASAGAGHWRGGAATISCAGEWKATRG